MRIFGDLGLEIERVWRGVSYDELAFPGIAAGALREARIPERIGADDVLDWLLSTAELPEQDDLEARFGEPPVTMYRGRRFYIQVLFWLTSSTSIHRHAFTGAFQVLHGSSLHSRYEFHARRRVCSQMLLGDVRLRTAELLQRGDIVEISRDLAHGLFHLEAPSATVVVRTVGEPEGSPQYDYRPPCVAVDPFFSEPVLTRWLQGLDLLHRSGSPRYVALAADLLERTDLHTGYLVLQHAYRRLDDLGRAAPLLAAAERRHGPVVAELAASLLEERRRRLIYRLRVPVRDPERRFFLALVQNLPDRGAIYAMIRRRYPDDDPRARVLAWTRALSGVDRIGIDLDDELNGHLLEGLLDGCSNAQIVDRLREEYDDEQLDAQAEQLARCIARMRRTMLAPLFRADLSGSGGA